MMKPEIRFFTIIAVFILCIAFLFSGNDATVIEVYATGEATPTPTINCGDVDYYSIWVSGGINPPPDGYEKSENGDVAEVNIGGTLSFTCADIVIPPHNNYLYCDEGAYVWWGYSPGGTIIWQSASGSKADIRFDNFGIFDVACTHSGFTNCQGPCEDTYYGGGSESIQVVVPTYTPRPTNTPTPTVTPTPIPYSVKILANYIDFVIESYAGHAWSYIGYPNPVPSSIIAFTNEDLGFYPTGSMFGSTGRFQTDNWRPISASHRKIVTVGIATTSANLMAADHNSATYHLRDYNCVEVAVNIFNTSAPNIPLSEVEDSVYFADSGMSYDIPAPWKLVDYINANF